MSAAQAAQASVGLDRGQRQRLDLLERVIEQGLARFLEVGQALTEIREQRLYRESHPSFEHYCLERWGFRRAHAHRLIQSARVLEALSPMGDTPTNDHPASERQARELTPLLREPEQLRRAWSDARDRATRSGSPLTARLVRATVTDHITHDGAHEHVGTDRWQTPADLFAVLDEEFRFELDVCALADNATCDHYYTPDIDGLKQPWRGRCWMNPPYGKTIAAWIAKASESAKKGAVVVSLLPVHTETGWWWDHCRQAEIRFIRGRLRFSNAPTAAPFASAVVVFGYPARVVWWNWRQQAGARRNG
jgi:phage N-6-adenine-methyltransferase